MTDQPGCPACAGTKTEEKFLAKDYTVSQEQFSIRECKDCTLRFTSDIPSANEIGAYYASENYISHTDTRKGMVNRLYHLVRKRTLGSKMKLVIKETGKQKGRLLDIGCGTGAFLNVLQTAGWETTGLEPDQLAREKANELYHIKPLAPGRLFELEKGQFDAVTMWHVLEHVHDLHGYIKRAGELLAPGGRLFIAVPNYTSYDATVYREHWAAYDVPRHLYHFSPASMKRLISTHGLQLRKVKPMWFDSFYVSMLSEQYKNGRGNLGKAVFNGLLSNLKAWGDTKKCSSVIYVISRIN